MGAMHNIKNRMAKSISRARLKTRGQAYAKQKSEAAVDEAQRQKVKQYILVKPFIDQFRGLP